MKTNIVAALALFCSFNLQAYSNFIENPHKPYPPGCSTFLTCNPNSTATTRSSSMKGKSG